MSSCNITLALLKKKFCGNSRQSEKYELPSTVGHSAECLPVLGVSLLLPRRCDTICADLSQVKRALTLFQRWDRYLWNACKRPRDWHGSSRKFASGTDDGTNSCLLCFRFRILRVHFDSGENEHFAWFRICDSFDKILRRIGLASTVTDFCFVLRYLFKLKFVWWHIFPLSETMVFDLCLSQFVSIFGTLTPYPSHNFYAKHALPRRWGQFATNQDTKRKAKRKDQNESQSPQSLIP